MRSDCQRLQLQHLHMLINGSSSSMLKCSHLYAGILPCDIANKVRHGRAKKEIVLLWGEETRLAVSGLLSFAFAPPCPT